MIGDQCPGFELGCMNRSTGVVRRNAIFGIGRETYVALVRLLLTADEVDVEHCALPERALLRQGFGGQPRSEFASAGYLA